MISAWHLLWIVPLSNLISMFAVGICGFGSKSESMSEAYSIGFRDGIAYKETEDGNKT